MNKALSFMHRFDRRQLLVGAVVILLVLNLGRWTMDFLATRQAELTDRMEMLAQYRKAVERQPALEGRIAQLTARRDRLESFLFQGEAEEQIASAMQIMLQSEITNAGLEPEFIQPMRSGQPVDHRERGEIAISIRMAGSLNDLGRFLHARYASNRFFRIAGLTVKPYRPGELKISMEVRGYYRIGKEGGAPP